MTISPAELQFDEHGTPFSERYGDVYHSRDGGLEQSHYVFLAGNGLPERWQNQDRFVVLETGFGLGLNFLATWAQWRQDPLRSRALHFVSCELHPFRVEDLRQLHARWPEFAPLAEQLQAQWPALAQGFHRLHFDHDQVTLTLYFGDARDGLAQLDAQVDAIVLDGFSPARNPELWSPRVFHLLARLSHPGTTLATWSVAGSVRTGLQHAGFSVYKAAGFGGKHHMLHGEYTPSVAAKCKPTSRLAPPPAEQRAIIIGAGLAGTAVAQRLAVRGWTIELIDAANGPAQGASGNHAGVLRPLPARDENPMHRLTRAGTLYGWRHIAALQAQGLTVQAEATGVLHLARDESQQRTMQEVVHHAALPTSVLRFVGADEASEIAGWPLAWGGWWFASSGWVQPPSLCAANLQSVADRVRHHWQQPVTRYDYQDGAWRVYDDHGHLIAAAPVLILAAGTGALDLIPPDILPIVKARGQVSLLPAEAGSAPHVVVCRMGYVSPAVEGWRCAGATFAVNDDDTALRAADHAENLAKLEGMLPGYTAGLHAGALHGRVGFRPASPDRLPMVGAVPVFEALEQARPLLQIPRQPGLYVASGFGARGLVWSALLAENLASQIHGDPLPLEQDLQDAIDPARFLVRAVRQRAKNGQASRKPRLAEE